MREPNFSFPHQNRAAICITSSIYDRRALDCTDYIPIINTLTNLAYLTGSTPTIRDFITRDGGLERLVTILKNTKVNDRRNGLKWTLAFQCVVNIGVRGTEHIRKRVVQAGMVPVIVNVLESFFAVLKSVSDENERKRALRKAESASQSRLLGADPTHDTATLGLGLTHSLSQTQPYSSPITDLHQTQTQGSDVETSAHSSSSSGSGSGPTPQVPSTSSSLSPSLAVAVSPAMTSLAPSTTTPDPIEDSEGSSRTHATMEALQGQTLAEDTSSIATDSETRPQQFFYREDDILHSLQLLAYLSKYPSLRSSFHTDSGSNVFAIVEKFTHRTLHPLEIQYWAGVIMRNACRKDDTRKGIRQCAYTGCGKWESKPREFAKCRRCRKAKYCSKQCQSKAWNEGHRWWCIEKKAETMGVSSSFGTDLPPAPPPPPPPADLQDQTDTNPSLMENGSISSVAPGAGGARMIGGGEGGSSTGHHVARMHHRTLVQPSSLSQQAPRPLQLSPAPLQHPYPSTQRSTSLQPAPYPHHHQEQRQQPQQPPSFPAVHTHSSPSQQAPPPQQHHQPQQGLPRHSAPMHQQQHFYPHPPQPQHAQPLAPSHQHQHPYPPQHHLHPQRPPFHLRASAGSLPSPSPSTHSHSPARSTPFAPQSAPVSAPLPVIENSRHLGVTPDSPTPEQLAQRFVQQVALHPGQHNELAQHLHAQFQQYFPPENQAEAKRQFSFHAREHFARYQRQQELLRNGGHGFPQPSQGAPARSQARSSHNGPSSNAGTSSTSHLAPPMPISEQKQGTARRRSDLDSDDEGTTAHSTSNLSMPMLTQDLSSNMSLSLSSTEFSGPLPTQPSENHHGMMQESSLTSGHHEIASSSQMGARDLKVRKLMTRDEQSMASVTPAASSSSSASVFARNDSGRGGEWSYSRQMAKDTSAP